MSKNQNPFVLNWQSTDPSLTFLPVHYPFGSAPSGTVSGVMTGATTIYSNILTVQQADNIGLHFEWTGTPTGTISVLSSNIGSVFRELTFSPALTQPTGSASGILVNLFAYPFTWVMISYLNISGTGTLRCFGQNKANNN